MTSHFKRANLSLLFSLFSPAVALLHAGDPSTTPLPAGATWSIDGQGHSHSSSRPDSHAPIGVMADHVHGKGEWMLSLRYMRMNMKGNRDGTTSLSNQDVLAQGFMVTPTEMSMEMWMLGGMYAPSDNVTLMAMLPYVRKEMTHLTGGGAYFDTSAEGVGDLRLSALIPLASRDSAMQAHVDAGLSLPTGSIDERDATPMNSDAKLPYPMQLGSGTYDLLLGATLQRQFDAFSVGGQARGTFRLDENDNGYTFGNRYEATAWSSWRFVESTSASARLAYASWEDIDGADPELNPNMVPTARPDLRSGERVDVGLGINTMLGSEWRLAAEALLPVYQYLDGPQLETDLTFVIGAQVSF